MRVRQSAPSVVECLRWLKTDMENAASTRAFERPEPPSEVSS